MIFLSSPLIDCFLAAALCLYFFRLHPSHFITSQFHTRCHGRLVEAMADKPRKVTVFTA